MSAATRSTTSDELNLHSHGGEHFTSLHCLLPTLLPVTFPCIWINTFFGYTSCHHKRVCVCVWHISSGCVPWNFIFYVY